MVYTEYNIKSAGKEVSHKMIKRKKLFLLCLMVLALLTLSAFLNYNSLNYTKNACTENNMTPKVDKSFFAFYWNVSCK